VTSSADASDLDLCCLPGDFTVTKIPTGFVIGRALDHLGPGPWWEYIAIVATFHEAYTHATRLAEEADRSAWLHKHGDDYELLHKPMNGEPPPDG
jgi:hypothetical protein